MAGLSREQMAWRAAQDIEDGALVNLGMGIPVAVSNHIPADRDVFLQAENALLVSVRKRQVIKSIEIWLMRAVAG